MSEEVQSQPTPRRRARRSNGVGSPVSPGAFAKETVTKKTKKERRRTNSGLSQRFVDVLGWTVLVIWAVGFSVDMLDLKKGWDLPAGIWGLMTIVSGAAFVANALKKETHDDD